MLNFLKHYFVNLFKQWWFIVVLISGAPPKILEVYSSYFPNDTETPARLLLSVEQYSRYFPLILVLAFIIANISIAYGLWKENISLKLTPIPTGLGDDYEMILDLVKLISPQKYDLMLGKLQIAFKHFTKQNLKNIICSHFGVYYAINSILEDCYRNRTIQRSIEVTPLIESFTNNYEEFSKLNDAVGRNDQIVVDTILVNKQILDITDNLRSIFSYYSK